MDEAAENEIAIRMDHDSHLKHLASNLIVSGIPFRFDPEGDGALVVVADLYERIKKENPMVREKVLPSKIKISIGSAEVAIEVNRKLIELGFESSVSLSLLKGDHLAPWANDISGFFVSPKGRLTVAGNDAEDRAHFDHSDAVLVEPLKLLSLSSKQELVQLILDSRKEVHDRQSRKPSC